MKIMFVFVPEMATLYVTPHPDDFRSLLALIVAEFCPSSCPRTLTEDPPASLNARSRPTLVLGTGEGDSILSGASAVAWYLALQGKRGGVDTKQQSQVWQWLSFADNELTPVSCAVVFPLIGVMGVDKKVRGESKCLLLTCVLFILVTIYSKMTCVFTAPAEFPCRVDTCSKDSRSGTGTENLLGGREHHPG